MQVNPCATPRAIRIAKASVSTGAFFLRAAQSSDLSAIASATAEALAKEDPYNLTAREWAIKVHSLFNKCAVTMIDFEALVISVNQRSLAVSQRIVTTQPLAFSL
jgi:hypothetical protein